LKQMALGFRIWADEHEGRFPMEVSWQEGGSKELTLRGWVAPSFWAASTQLNSPRMLTCPADKKRLPRVTNFASLADRKVSYFLGVDSAISNPQSVLGGDRNLATNNVALPAGLATIADPRMAGWTRESLHRAAGNLAFADGSVQQMTSESLRRSLDASGQRTNTVVIP
jgi:prepilin-type processing-associated H-X9-DG protein